LFGERVTVDETGTPCRLSTEGETEHVEFGGPPEQLKFTVPVRPAIGVTVME
jgi:hypothetical protein